jgi:two-component system, NtrC family, response regulator PilR
MELNAAGRRPDGWSGGHVGFPEADGGLSDEDVATAARAGGSVLITGPVALALTAARRIHDESDRRDGPFTVVDCGGPPMTVTERLVEAFGDAMSEARPVTASAGTLYMKDVGALPRVAQRLVAGLLAHPGRTRVIASHPRPLLDRVVEGDFDDSLFYRLNVVHLVIERDASPR